jgi:hypothetical protein
MQIEGWNKFECSAVLCWCEIELTNYCQLDCFWCIRKQSKEYGFMSKEDLEKIINFISKNWYQEIVLSWLWDSFLHKELYIFLDYIFLKDPWIRVYIMTKWQSINYSDIDKFLFYKQNWFNVGLTFSIFSLNEKKYYKTTWWWNLQNLLNIIKYSNEKKINFNFEFFIDNNNIKNISSFKKFAEIFSKSFHYSIPHNWWWNLDNIKYERFFSNTKLYKLIQYRDINNVCEVFKWKYLFFDFKWWIFKCWLNRFNNEFYLGNIKDDLTSYYNNIDYNNCKNCSYYYYKTKLW